MLEVAREVGQLHGVTFRTSVADAADLSQFPDESFDIVYGANVLHHVEIDRCLSEVVRVLKPGGRAAFWDPVHYNPAIQIYRRMATEVRTDDEHPLRRADLVTLRRHFSDVSTRGFWLTGLLVFVKFFVIDRIKPNSERYWKLVVDKQDDLSRSLRWFHAIDRTVLRVVPPLRWLCWNLAVVAHKPPAARPGR
jgi:SAM-dependent methyltransferase